MENKNQDTTFSYTYSAYDQEELKRIRGKYVPKEEDKMEQLRKLDRSVTQKVTVIGLVVGIIGALVLGVGMCCTMVWQGVWFIPGIIIGVIGIAIMAVTYPICKKITQKERERVAPEIIRLSDELMK